MRFNDEFLQFYMILGCLEVPVLTPFGTNCCKKTWSRKKMRKVMKKGDGGHAMNLPWVPLKNNNQDIRHQIQTTRDRIEHTLACLAARWRIKSLVAPMGQQNNFSYIY